MTMSSVRRSYQRTEQSDLGVEDGDQPQHLHLQPPVPHPPDHTIMIQDTRVHPFYIDTVGKSLLLPSEYITVP